MSPCSDCTPESHGIVIHFPDELTAIQAIPERTVFSNLAIRLNVPYAVWCMESLVYELVDFWNEHFHPEEWRYGFADYVSPDLWHPNGNITWSQIISGSLRFEIDDIIRTRQIKMMYQPIVEWTRDATLVIGYEMLVRGLDAKERIIPPNQLFAAAKKQGRLYEMDRICRLEALWAGSICPEDTKLFINFIPTSIYSPTTCLQSTIEEAKDLHISLDRLVFEVIETEKVNDLVNLAAILDDYRDQGIHYALDDVGKGYNTIEVIQELKPDIVKLDREFVQDIYQFPEKQQVAIRIAETAESIGATLLAEGVEKMEESIYLQDIGYYTQQGFLFGRPEWFPLPAGTLQVAEH